jgi:hypothetical protein
MRKGMAIGVALVMVLMGLFVMAPNVAAHTEDDPYVTDLIADGGEIGIDVGDVKIWNDETNLYVEYVITGTWYLTQTHLHVALSMQDIPQTKKGNPIPGQFDYSSIHELTDYVQSKLYTIDLAEAGFSSDDNLVIAAHAVVYNTAETEGELVVNGGFETPIVTASQGWDIFDSGTTGLGWTVEWYGGSTSYGGQTRPEPAHLELHRGVNSWLPNDGYQHAELDTDWDGPGGGLSGEPASVNIYQDLPTSGGYCNVKYSWSPRPAHSDNQLAVYWGGTQIGTHSGSGGSNTMWTDESYILTSTENDRLEFIETATPDSLGMFLDSVSVECFRKETAWGDGEDFPGNNWGMYIAYGLQSIVTFPEEGNAYIGYEDRTAGDFDYNDFGMNMFVQETYVSGCLSEISMTFESVKHLAGDNHDIHIKRTLSSDTEYEYTIMRTTTAQGNEDPEVTEATSSGDFDIVLFDSYYYTYGDTVTIFIKITACDDFYNPSPTPPRWDLDPIWAYYDPWMYDRSWGPNDWHIDDWQPATIALPTQGYNVPYILVVPYSNWPAPVESQTITGPYPDFDDYYHYNSPENWYEPT